MTPLKFRAWHKQLNAMSDTFTMFSGKGLDFECNAAEKGRYPLDAENLIVMQSTGLTDKNGQTIWEGDIVLATDPFGTYTRFIRWENARFVAPMTHGGTTQHLLEYLKDVEVIGNVHENAELLSS